MIDKRNLKPWLKSKTWMIPIISLFGILMFPFLITFNLWFSHFDEVKNQWKHLCDGLFHRIQ